MNLIYLAAEVTNKYTHKFQQSVKMSAQQNCIWNVITFRAVLHKNDCWNASYIAANVIT
jgi:hypothetical protein